MTPTSDLIHEAQIAGLGRPRTDLVNRLRAALSTVTAERDGLRKHIHSMQGYVREYLEPGTYVAKHGEGGTFSEPHKHQAPDYAYIMRSQMRDAVLNDLIHMLDGPEERAALHVTETPETEHEAGDVLTPTPATDDVIDRAAEPVTLTSRQKLEALSLRFYQGMLWTPKAGDYYTTSRADLELYQIVAIEGGKVQTRYCIGSTAISEWPENEFTTGGFGPKRVYVPDFVLTAFPAQEPVAWRETDGDKFIWHDATSQVGKHIAAYPHMHDFSSLTPLYAHPPAAQEGR